MDPPFKSFYSIIESPFPLAIHHLGPDLNKGPLPSLFYFALSGEESLTLDPYNQPAVFLAQHPIRILSFTLPGHGPGYATSTAISLWGKELAEGHNIIAEFIEAAVQNIDYLIEQGIIHPKHLAAAGLSRGGFIATHLAARDPRIHTVVGYAPMTRLTFLKEFAEIHSYALDLIHLVEKLVHKKIRFYIGNRDLRVGTKESYQFIETLAETQHQAGYRSPPAELIITPSIGHKGHGTSLATFHDGMKWLQSKI